MHAACIHAAIMYYAAQTHVARFGSRVKRFRGYTIDCGDARVIRNLHRRGGYLFGQSCVLLLSTKACIDNHQSIR